jgi:hypothetical protein
MTLRACGGREGQWKTSVEGNAFMSGSKGEFIGSLLGARSFFFYHVGKWSLISLLTFSHIHILLYA